MKRDGANAGAASGKRTGSSSNTPLPCVLKYLAPDAMAAAIIGKGGAVIAGMRASCSAKVVLTEQGEVYSWTDCRVLTTSANTEESLNEVSRQIVGKLAELVKTCHSAVAEAVGTEGEIKIRLLVPRAAVGGVIGKGGASIKQIRESSGAKISISDPEGSGPGAEQLISVMGSSEALEIVLSEVNRQVQLLNTEPWFANWATATCVVKAGAQGGYPAASMPPASAVAASNLAAGAGMQWQGAPGAPQLMTSGMPGMDVMMRVAQNLPPYVMEDSRGFAMSCVVPSRLVGGLIGRGGSGTREVQNLTGTMIGIREISDDPDNRSLNIAGSLANTCAAYMLMMKRYLDAEAQSLASGAAGGQQ